ncbi:hypothetical protein [Bradyrhizobium ganzhouense]|uniref:hypothetical protein n=1 Tax=Bradyrhizobium ganzhouense TaxID=1179767 RepID=UPI003CFACF79
MTHTVVFAFADHQHDLADRCAYSLTRSPDAQAVRKAELAVNMDGADASAAATKPQSEKLKAGVRFCIAGCAPSMRFDAASISSINEVRQ